MIKLTILDPSDPKTLVFSKNLVTIGSQLSDLPLPELHDEHIKIEEKDQKFIVINVKNDPFTLLNGYPFGKKTLCQNDLIEIGTLIIKFEGELSKKENPLPLPTPIEANNFTPPPFENETEHQEIETEQAISPLPIKPKRTFLSWATLSFAFLGLVSLSFFLIYSKINKQSFQEEIIAAEGVSDVSMALAYAKIHRLSPQKQNWSDPDFIKNNLSSVLSTEYPSFANIDPQGQFKNCPYILRIYTSHDLKNFLVIAQPEPSFLQWLFPREAIIVDSSNMEIRRISDLKNLNRILLNVNALNGANGSEISQLVKEGSLISLATLGTKKGFMPPKSLSLMRPEAENKVYNAPRYYHLGESLLKRSSELAEKGSPEEISLILRQLNELQSFPNMVLYSTVGFELTLDSQKALNFLAPQFKFLTALLNINDEGTIASSHLLLNGEPLENSGHKLQRQLDKISEIASVKLPSFRRSNTTHVDSQHPLFQKLEALKAERQQELEEVSDKIVTLLANNNELEDKSFSDNLDKLLTRYQEKNLEWHEKLLSNIESLKKEHTEEEISSYLKACELDYCISDENKNLVSPK